MRRVSIKTHIVGSGGGIAFRSDDLVALFATADIELDITAGDPIAVDPALSAIHTYQTLCSDYAAQDTSAGHLIIGGLPPDGVPADVIGQLHDLNRRGVAAVYTSTPYMQQFQDAGLAQTAAHEIGHMCNLSHADIWVGHQSVMDQATSRTELLPDSWSYASQQSASENPSYFEAQPRELCVYPFAYQARCQMNTQSLSEMTPWGGPFNHADEGTNDQFDQPHRLEVVLSGATLVTGGPLYFDVIYHNLGRYPARTPAHLNPDFGTVELTVLRPDGLEFRYRPHALGCSIATMVVAAGGASRHSFSTCHGALGPVLPMPGRYVVNIRLAGGRAAIPVSFEVEARSGSGARRPGWEHWLASACARPTAGQRRKAFEIATGGAQDAATRAQLAYRLLQRELRHGHAEALLDQAAAGDAPRAVRHRAVVMQARRARHRGCFDTDAADAMITRFLARPEDENLHDSIREIAA